MTMIVIHGNIFKLKLTTYVSYAPGKAKLIEPRAFTTKQKILSNQITTLQVE